MSQHMYGPSTVGLSSNITFTKSTRIRGRFALFEKKIGKKLIMNCFIRLPTSDDFSRISLHRVLNQRLRDSVESANIENELLY